MKYVALLFSMLILMGMVPADSGIVVSEEEAAVCKQQGCTVWTEAELEFLIRLSLQEGIAHGRSTCGVRSL